jgi:hypothetical protein
MTITDEADLQEQRLKYIGAVTASLSHEINNVLAIVGELSGLIDDLVEGAPEGRLDPVRFKTIGEKIARHVERGKGQVSILNRFAHSVDDSWSTFEAGESVAAVVAVCDRFARLAKVELRLDGAEGWPRLEGPLSDFEHLVFRAIGAALLTVDRGGTVSVGLVIDGGVNRLEVVAGGPAPANEKTELAARLELIEALAVHLGMEVEQPRSADRNLTLSFALPKILEPRLPERSR